MFKIRDVKVLNLIDTFSHYNWKTIYIKKTKFSLLFLFIILTLEVLFYPNIIMPEIYNSLILWSTKVVPSLLPFFLLTHFLMNYGLTNILSELFKPIMKLFKTNSNK